MKRRRPRQRDPVILLKNIAAFVNFLQVRRRKRQSLLVRFLTFLGRKGCPLALVPAGISIFRRV
jgi:hypothetical protein